MLRWPALREVLLARAAADDQFASLCEIYAEAHEALEVWQRSGHALASARASEYRDMLAEIEIDILDRIDTFR